MQVKKALETETWSWSWPPGYKTLRTAEATKSLIENLEKALGDYCGELKKKGLIKSCAKPGMGYCNSNVALLSSKKFVLS